MESTSDLTQCHLIVFSRRPDSPGAKSRLRKPRGIPTELVQKLHRAFVADTMETARQCRSPVAVAWHPDPPEEVCESYPDFLHLPQNGESFAARIHSALLIPPADTPRILIGSDCPYLTPDLIRSACTHTLAGRAVVGPAPSGGFYLLGLPSTVATRNISQCFEHRDQVSALEELFSDVAVELLPELVDIDELPELRALCRWLQSLSAMPQAVPTQCQHLRAILPELLQALA